MNLDDRHLSVAMLLSNPATNDPRPLREAHSLASRGYRVTVFAWDRDRATTTDSIYSDGVTVKRFHLHAGHGTPVFTVPRLLLFHLWCLVQLAASGHKVVHCHDVDTLPVGIAVKATGFRGMRLVYDMHDLPEAFLRFFPFSETLQRAFLGICRKAADLVVVASEGYVGFLLSMGFKEVRVAVVLNAPALKEGKQREKTGTGLRVLYYGGLEEERGVKVLVEAVSHLTHVTLTIAGRGKLERWVRKAAESIPAVKFLGWLSMAELDSRIGEADLIPSLYEPGTKNTQLSTPGKLLTSLSVSVPVLVPAGTHQAELVKRYGCGVEVTWGRIGEITEALGKLSTDEQLYARMSSSAYAAFRGSLNWEAMEARLVEAYQSLG